MVSTTEKDWEQSKASFLRFTSGYRLGSIATNLSRISGMLQDCRGKDAALYLIRETVYFIEWTASDVSLEIAVELVDLGRLISSWKFNWEELWSSVEERSHLSQEARTWSNQMLERSGLCS